MSKVIWEGRGPVNDKVRLVEFAKGSGFEVQIFYESNQKWINSQYYENINLAISEARKTGWRPPGANLTKAKKSIPKLKEIDINLETAQREAHALMKEKGFWGADRSPTTLMLRAAQIAGEAHELMEYYRKGQATQPGKVPAGDDGAKYTNEAEELADIILRTLDLAEARGISITPVIKAKFRYNQTRDWSQVRDKLGEDQA
jgi:NTP pyrophosphatase (non-canonical NTP hydrolase)